MKNKIFIFELDGIRVTYPKTYYEEPTKDQIINDMKE